MTHAIGSTQPIANFAFAAAGRGSGTLGGRSSSMRPLTAPDSKSSVSDTGFASEWGFAASGAMGGRPATFAKGGVNLRGGSGTNFRKRQRRASTPYSALRNEIKASKGPARLRTRSPDFTRTKSRQRQRRLEKAKKRRGGAGGRGSPPSPLSQSMPLPLSLLERNKGRPASQGSINFGALKDARQKGYLVPQMWNPNAIVTSPPRTAFVALPQHEMKEQGNTGAMDPLRLAAMLKKDLIALDESEAKEQSEIKAISSKAGERQGTNFEQLWATHALHKVRPHTHAGTIKQKQQKVRGASRSGSSRSRLRWVLSGGEGGGVGRGEKRYEERCKQQQEGERAG